MYRISVSMSYKTYSITCKRPKYFFHTHNYNFFVQRYLSCLCHRCLLCAWLVLKYHFRYRIQNKILWYKLNNNLKNHSILIDVQSFDVLLGSVDIIRDHLTYIWLGNEDKNCIDKNIALAENSCILTKFNLQIILWCLLNYAIICIDDALMAWRWAGAKP